MILTIIAVYLVIGSLLARHRYAQELGAQSAASLALELKQRQAELKSIVHSNDCWRGPRHNNEDHNCDCQMARNWLRTKREIERLERGSPKTSSPYAIVFGWPLVAYHAFLTGGTPKTQPIIDPELTARLERELGIGEKS